MGAENQCCFIGGVGRCGTSILGEIFTRHTELFYIGESMFSSPSAYSVPAVFAGSLAPDDFRKWVLDQGRERILKSCGIYYPNIDFSKVYSVDMFEGILDELFSGPVTPASAARFMDSLFSAGAKFTERRLWVEKTPHSVVCVNILSQILPNLRYVHIQRDPRDVASSMFKQEWGPNCVEEFIPYWNSLMGMAFEQAGRIPESGYFVVSLERLCENPFFVLERVFGFCGVDTSRGVIDYSCRNLDVERANIGRWKNQLTAGQAKLIEQGCFGLYSKWLEFENKCLGEVAASNAWL